MGAMSPTFPALMREHFGDFLRRKGFQPRFIDELAEAICLVNYGQSVSELRAFVGAVSLAGAGDDLWAIDGGNRLIAERLLKVK